MAYALNHFDEHESRQSEFGETVTGQYTRLIQHAIGTCDKFGHKINNGSNDQITFVEDKQGCSSVLRAIACPSLPSPFACFALSRFAVLKCSTFLDILNLANSDKHLSLIDNNAEDDGSINASKLVTLGLNCLLSVLEELHEKDPPVCVNALDALLNLLQSLYPEELVREPSGFIEKLFELLQSMSESSAQEIATRSMSCLLALAVARGQPQYLLKASHALLNCNQSDGYNYCQQIAIPCNYQMLYSHLFNLAAASKSDGWMSTDAHFFRVFTIALAEDEAKTSPSDSESLITCDGCYLYLLTSNQLSKIGSGFGESIRAFVYKSTMQFGSALYSWMSACNGSLYLKKRQTSRLIVLDSDTLAEIGEVLLPATLNPNAVLCADGQSFFTMTLDSDGTLTVTAFDDNFTLGAENSPENPEGCELKTKLTINEVARFGHTTEFKPDIKPLLLESVCEIHQGPDLTLVLTTEGKVFYCGKGSKIGMQDTGESWSDMRCLGSDLIVSISSNLESDCVLFRSSNGHVWCAGNAYGSESIAPAIFAASTRNRRKSVAEKPRRLTVTNHKKIISCAVSASTTAVVTENGKVYLFGRHATHCHQETGQVLGLEHVHLIQIALGKSHIVAVSRHGHVYTWGLNNLYQCGRAEGVSSTTSEISGHSSSPRHLDSEGATSTPSIQMCSPAEHLWVKDVTTLCTTCGQCSGHGNRCTPPRVNPLLEANVSSCGPGESGCIRCGVCRKCGEHQQQASDIDARSDRDVASDSSGGGRSTGLFRMLLNPGRLMLKLSTTDLKVTHAVCGNYHTLLLTADKLVFSFGSNCHGQLGVGDCKRRSGPQQIQLPSQCTPEQLAAGANHSLIRTTTGQVFSFGSNREGQLGREGSGKFWQSCPDVIPAISSNTGYAAVWVGASNDTTIIKIHKTLIKHTDLPKTQISMNSELLMVFPTHSGQTNGTLILQRKTGKFTQLKAKFKPSQQDSWCVDPKYDIVWHFDAAFGHIHAYSHWKLGSSSSDPMVDTINHASSISDVKNCDIKNVLDFLKDPEFWISAKTGNGGSTGSQTQLGLNALAVCYGIVLSPKAFSVSTNKNVKGQHPCLVLDRPEDSAYHVVCRFQNYGGGWGYSAQSVEAIQFQPSHDVNVIGLGLFAGRGEYLARIKILRLVGQDFDEQNLELLVESEEILFESPPREKAHIFLGRSALCHAGQWYIAWAQINGPSSDCGAGGQSTAAGDDGISFNFRSSRLSNNGTDMHVGQIPLILYNTIDVKASARLDEASEGSQSIPLKLGRLMQPSVKAFEAIILLLRWSMDYCFTSCNQLSTVCLEGSPDSASSSTSSIPNYDKTLHAWKLERGVTICIMTLRLLVHYSLQVYPRHSTPASEKVEYSPSMVPLRRILWEMLKMGHNLALGDPRTLLMDELVQTVKKCLHIMLPTTGLLQDAFIDKMTAGAKSDWSMIALIESLCDEKRPVSMLNNPSQITPICGSSRYPQLIADAIKTKKTARSQNAPLKFPTLMSFCLELIFAPPTPEDGSLSQSRLRDAASRLLTVVASELVQTAADGDSSPIIATCSRFCRLSSTPVWDISSGTADAISFRVSTSGLCLHGAGCYVGGAGDYAYNMEVLVNQSDGIQETWQVLEKSSGSAVCSDEFDSSIALIRLNKPVKLQPAHIYAVRLYLQGNKTWSGESGVSLIKCVDGVTFTFYPCSLSLNGTSTSRGQIPVLLYSTNGHQSASASISAAECCSWFLLLLRNLSTKLMACLNVGLVPCDTDLFSQVYGWTSVLLESKPQHSVAIFGALDELVPIIASANTYRRDTETATTVQSLVENEHPYKPGKMYSQRVVFDREVHFVCLEFSPQCSTAHPNDVLCVYVHDPKKDACSLIGKYSATLGFPSGVIVVPGNSLWFVLETCSGNGRPPAEQLFGFQCLVTGNPAHSSDPLSLMELELSWLCAAACRHLICMPVTGLHSATPVKDLEDDSAVLVRRHGNLLRKGLSLAHVPTIHEVLQGKLPPRNLSPELKFLSDFMHASALTVAGQLARWFTPQPFIDIHNCELALRSPEVRVGQPCLIELILKDQHGNCSAAKDIEIEVCVRLGNVEAMDSSDDHQQYETGPIQKSNYQQTYLNKARYISISMMPAYQKYSFEEMRLVYFKDSVLKENIGMSQTEKMTYQGQWTARQCAKYTINCTIDKFMLPQSYTVEVKDGARNAIVRAAASKKEGAKVTHIRSASVPSNAWTQGVRVRSSPNLRASQIGFIPRGCSINYCEELENTDGVWVQLNDEAVVMHCPNVQPPIRAWCLQYSAMLNKTLMLRTGYDHQPMASISSTTQSMVVTSEELYVVIRGSKLKPDAVPIFPIPMSSMEVDAFLNVNETIRSVGWLHNKEGVWIRVQDCQCQSTTSPRKKVSVSDGFCQVQDSSGTVYLQTVQDSPEYMGHSSSNSSDISPARKIEKKKPTAQVHPQPTGVVNATPPAIIDCMRTVYAALLWQDNLVHDAMACSAYLKFHPELRNTKASNIPASMQLLFNLWKEVEQTIRISIDQHMVLPSSPLPSNNDVASASHGEGNNGMVCELCDVQSAIPLAAHMRLVHPGCGSYSGGHGYNSLGRYTSGWTGNCGDGGRGAATWYLLCGTCRTRHLNHSPSGHREARPRRSRTSNQAVITIPAHVIIKQNANFLLELESYDESSNIEMTSASSSVVAAPSRRTSTWTINLFPHTTTPPFLVHKGTGTSRREANDSGSQTSTNNDMPSTSYAMTTHTSDPGPKRHLATAFQCSIPSSEPFRSCRPNDGSREIVESQMLLASPSAALRTMAGMIEERQLSNDIPAMDVDMQGHVQRPVIAFVTQHHDLKRVKDAMRLAVMRCVALAHAFKAWNWLLRILSNEQCVMNVVWNYISAMSDSKGRLPGVVDQNQAHNLLYHPCRMTILAGSSSKHMLHQFHAFLKTIAVIIRSGCADTLLRRMCFRAWMFELTPHEQDLIRSCQLLSSVGQLLYEQENGNLADMSSIEGSRTVEVDILDDISEAVTIETSSRPEMSQCLTDGNTETFWESAEGDRSKTRTIKFSICDAKATGLLLGVFIDNQKDDSCRISQVVISSSSKSHSRCTILCQNIDSHHSGWLKCAITDRGYHFKIDLKGPDVSVRIRSIGVLGCWVGERHRPMRPSVSNLQPLSGSQLDAFSLFQAIASQAFNDSLAQDHSGALREQVFDILFSREQLQPLQSYVCSQLMSALEREVEALRSGKRNYSYCCGLLALLARICTGTTAKALLSSRHSVLVSISELLLFSSSIVQCQIIDTIEKLIPLVDPALADIASLTVNLLVVIAKSVNLLVRTKASRATSSASVQTCAQAETLALWRLDRPGSVEIGKLVQTLLNMCTDGKFGVGWAEAMQIQLSNHIMTVTKSTFEQTTEQTGDEIARAWLKTRAFWLAVAALTSIKDGNWLKLSPLWKSEAGASLCGLISPRPLCENHDDGKTLAHVFCESCQMALCRECFSILHLNKRFRGHAVTILPQSTKASNLPEIDVHDGSTRLRIRGLLLLLDASTLNGMAQFHSTADSFNELLRRQRGQVSPSESSSCRFCGCCTSEGVSICSDVECQSHKDTACSRLLSCGHLCGGVNDEMDCLPCLKCGTDRSGTKLRQDCDDLCVICFTDRLGAAPSIQLTSCGHMFHLHCCKTTLAKKWPGPRISFTFMRCPLCQKSMEHASLKAELAPVQALYEQVANKAKIRLQYDGINECSAVTSPDSHFYQDPVGYALDRYVYVLCHLCGKAYFGGESHCQGGLISSQYKANELVCGACSDVSSAQMCPRHGAEYLEYKCRYCCSVAVFFCFGTTHFCATCHDDFQRLIVIPKQQLPQCPVAPKANQLDSSVPCPLKLTHPPTGEEFALGCGICRNISSF